MGGIILGSEELISADVHTIIRQTGPSLSPFNAWVMLKGLETLDLRVRRMTENADRVARFLDTHPKVAKTLYPGLPSHPQYALAQRQMGAGSTLVAFEVAGDKAATFRLGRRSGGDRHFQQSRRRQIDHLTPGDDDASAHRTGGRGPNSAFPDSMLRLSVGLEDADDLIADLGFALDQV